MKRGASSLLALAVCLSPGVGRAQSLPFRAISETDTAPAVRLDAPRVSGAKPAVALGAPSAPRAAEPSESQRPTVRAQMAEVFPGVGTIFTPVDAPSATASTPPFYANLEYLLWWLKKDNVPPLVTSGSPNDLPPGALGQPGTSLLFGNQEFGSNPFSGLRLTLGYWFGCEQNWAVEGSAFFLQQRRAFFAASNDGNVNQTLNVPFFSGDTGQESAFPIAGPGVPGFVNVQMTQRFWGAELNGRYAFRNCSPFQVQLIGGFRYLSLEESLDLMTGNTFRGFGFQTTDSFATRNHFYGGQIGAEVDYTMGKFKASVVGKLAMGVNNEQVNISSFQTVIPPGGNAVTGPGIYALGNSSRNQFAIVPELGFNVAYQITQSISATLGYNFLYINRVVRPGEQIDRTVTFANPGRPAVPFDTTSFWAQGITAGITFRY